VDNGLISEVRRIGNEARGRRIAEADILTPDGLSQPVGGTKDAD
jgi:hypothetical protein